MAAAAAASTPSSHRGSSSGLMRTAPGKVIEYCFNKEGNKFEVVTTITPVGKLTRAPTTRSSIKRNPMSSYADAMEDDAKSRLTNVSTKRILPERPHFLGIFRCNSAKT
jgi:hypothetical protein